VRLLNEQLDIGTLRARFKAAYGVYRLHSTSIDEQVNRGERPGIELLQARERAGLALGAARRDLLDTLFQNLVFRMERLTQIGNLAAAVQRSGVANFYTLRVLQRWQRGELDTEAAARLLDGVVTPDGNDVQP
jgi:hypothetical protein